MRPIKPADGVLFANYELESFYLSLSENDWLKKSLNRVIQKLKENVFCGERIKKELIPKEYIKKYSINNLLWTLLPNAWRLVYSIIGHEYKTFALIIEYFDHKNYERRFGY